MGLQINTQKTKYMHVGIQTEISCSLQNLIVGPHNIESVSEFVQLGSQVTNNNGINAEIRGIIYLENRIYFGLRKHLKSDIVYKSKIYKTLIVPVLTYASKTWFMTQNDGHLLGTFEGKVFKHIYGGIQKNGGEDIALSYTENTKPLLQQTSLK